MFRVAAAWIAMVVISGVSAAQTPAKVSPAPQSSPNNSSYDVEAERQLLILANQVRAEAGAGPLQMDEGLTRAARAHAAEMAERQQLSHQFAGEPALAQRLATNCTLHLDQAGENVAYAVSADQAHASLMHSPPHRENLLNPAYNVAGIGVVRAGQLLYVAQDFGHSLPAYSPRQAGNLVSGSIARQRRQNNLPPLQWMDSDAAQSTACSMAKADSLKTVSARASYMVRYTTTQPETLPEAAARAIEERGVHIFSVGTCYARTPTYPNGAYWVTLVLQ